MIADIDTLFAEAPTLSGDSHPLRSRRVKTILGEQVSREIEQSLAARRMA